MEDYFKGFGVLVIFLVIFGIIYFNFGRLKKTYILFTKIKKENDFLKKRSSELNKIVSFNNKFRNKWFYLLLGGIALSVILYFISKNYLLKIEDHSIIVLILFAVWGAYIYYILKEYKKGFSDNIVKPILNKYNSDLEYNMDKGFTIDEYKSLNFLERLNIVNSSNLIINKKTNLIVSDIEVIDDGRDSEGDYVITKLYEGTLFKLDVKNINSKILMGDVRELISIENSCKTIKTNNDNFNNLYKLSCSNDTIISKILNEDIVNSLINLKNRLGCNIDIRIINDKLYVRVNNVYNIKPFLIYNKIEIHSILLYLVILEEVEKVMYLIKNRIEDVI